MTNCFVNENYLPKDAAYINMHNLAAQMLKDGEIISMSATFDKVSGRMIHVETDQGWNPHAFYQEFSEDESFCEDSSYF